MWIMPPMSVHYKWVGSIIPHFEFRVICYDLIFKKEIVLNEMSFIWTPTFCTLLYKLRLLKVR